VRFGLAFAGVAGLFMAGTAQPAAALFIYTLSAGPQSLQAAIIPAPTGLSGPGEGVCSSGEQERVTITWTGSTATDANGNYLVRYYGVLRGIDGATPTLVGGVPGNPPTASYTDSVTCSGGAFTTMTVTYEVQAATAASGGFRSAHSGTLAVQFFVF
jgi:hypothetical protein